MNINWESGILRLLFNWQGPFDPVQVPIFRSRGSAAEQQPVLRQHRPGKYQCAGGA